MVEAAGIEPASEKVRTPASTRLASSLFYLTRQALNGKCSSSQPLHFAWPLGASRPDYPEFASPRPIASGRLLGRRHSLSCECQRIVASYCSFTGLTRSETSTCY